MKKLEEVYVARNGVTGAPAWNQAWGWGSQASAWWPGLHPWDLAGCSPNERRGPALQWVHHLQEGSEGAGAVGFGWKSWAGPRRPNPQMVTLAMGTWNVTSLGGKEPELVQEVERYRLEIVGLTSTYSLGSGT